MAALRQPRTENRSETIWPAHTVELKTGKNPGGKKEKIFFRKEVKTPGIDLAAEGRAWTASGQIAGP